MFRSGDQIGPYTLINKLGRGAFGTVWLSERRTTIATTTAALKIPLDEDVDLETIKHEANLWVRASGHPNVLPIIEANIYDDQVIIASEYAPDGSLELWLKQHGKAPTAEAAVEIISGVLAGLEHLHARNIIHRDLKPANILFQGSTPRLADFGISRVLKSTSQSSIIVAGTPSYMAPEAFDGKRNGQTDIWSVGVIFYQLLAGRLPFPQTDITSLVGAILSRHPDPLPISVPASLQEVIASALAKDPSQRFHSVAEMRAALRNPTESNRRVRYQQKSVTTIPASPADTVPPESKPFQPVRRSSPHLIYAGAGLLAVLIVVIGIVVLLKSGESNNSSPNSTTTPTYTVPSQSSKPTQKQETKVVTVDAQTMWTNSNILANKGDVITVEASGQVNGDIAQGYPAYKWVGPDGWGQQSPYIKPGSKMMWVLGRTSYMCLTGRIGDGTPFNVGSHYSFTSNSSGYLYFGVNDELLDENGNTITDTSTSGTWRNNGGAFTVKINRIFSE